MVVKESREKLHGKTESMEIWVIKKKKQCLENKSMWFSNFLKHKKHVKECDGNPYFLSEHCYELPHSCTPTSSSSSLFSQTGGSMTYHFIIAN